MRRALHDGHTPPSREEEDSKYNATSTLAPSALEPGSQRMGLTHVANAFASERAVDELTERSRAAERVAAGRKPQLSDLAVRRAAFFLLPLLLVAWLEEWGWDRLVWHDHGMLFPGPALEPGALILALIVPLLALPQATHYVWDAFLWKVKPANAAAVAAMGIR